MKLIQKFIAAFMHIAFYAQRKEKKMKIEK